MSTCPNCTNIGLAHTLVAGTLPANGCRNCGGISISLVAYRVWRERYGLSESNAVDSRVITDAEDSSSALLCPKCRHLMTKYRLSANVPNRIDYCGNCEEIWLDRYEWDLVEQLLGSGELVKIITQPWQHRVLDQSIDVMETNRLRKDFGNDYDKVCEFEKLIRDHPARLEILAFLSRSSR